MSTSLNLRSALRAIRAPGGLVQHVLLEAGLADRYAIEPSPAGELYVAFNRRGITQVAQAPNARAFERRYLARVGRAVVFSDTLPVKARKHFDLSHLTEFQRAVLEKARQIPRGQIRPYGWIAAEIGRPSAVRAVGTALAKNPVPYFIPCHRVVRSDGTIGAYALGSANKQRLLESEGVAVTELENRARAGVRFVGSRTTHIFCYPTCGSRRIMEKHRLEFASAKEARGQSYRPCKLCRPVQSER
ncbi:MAG: hypothetical protein NVS9B12_09540 [Vulcanimicrobiaceae bacterium]